MFRHFFHAALLVLSALATLGAQAFEVSYLQTINTRAGEAGAEAYAIQHRATLVFAGQHSTYQYAQGGEGKQIEQKSDDYYRVSFDDGKGRVYHADREKGKMISREMVMDQPAIITEDIPNINWSLTDQTRDIGGYACRLARAHFRGRDYRAWFTPEIPVSAGPWKLSGLPGLILEAGDASGVITFTFAGLREPSDKALAANRAPRSGKPMNFATFYRLRQEKIDEHLARIAAMPGVTIKAVGKKEYFELSL